MSLKGRFKKAIKRIGGKTVMQPIKAVKKFFDPPKEKEDTGTRAEAAKQLQKLPTTRQAGSGQVSFTKEEEV